MFKMIELATDAKNIDHAEMFSKMAPQIEKRTNVFHQGKLVSFSDFGVVFVGNDCLTAFSKPFWEATCGVEDTDILWHAPHTWRMPVLLKTLGAFPSTSQASKNGWNLDIPIGFEQFVIRINKVRGVLTTVKGAAPTNLCGSNLPK